MMRRGNESVGIGSKTAVSQSVGVPGRTCGSASSLISCFRRLLTAVAEMGQSMH